MLGIIAIADIIAMMIIPHIIEFESVILALIMIISTIVGGFIGVLQNKPTQITTDEVENTSGGDDVQ